MSLETDVRLVFAASILVLGLAGCATHPYRHESFYQHASYRPLPQQVAPPPAALSFYPAREQKPEQVERDRFECHEWAVAQSGYDPSVVHWAAPAHSAHYYRDTTPARDTVAGTVAGAAVGGIVASPGHTGTGMAIGAVTGALVGAAADQNRATAIENANAAQQEAQTRAEHAAAMTLDERVVAYQRALTACGVGRGYSVR